MAWIWRGDDSGYAEQLLDRLEKEPARVHAHWYAELADALVDAGKKGVDPAKIERFMELVLRLPITIDSTRREEWVGRTLALAREQGLSASQAAVLELAIREGLPIGSLDGDLRRAATAMGIEIVEVNHE